MNHIRAVHNPVATYMGTLWYVRWIVYTAISTIWYLSTRTAYIIGTIFSIAFIALSALSIEAYHKPDGILIIVEEVLIFIWFLLQLLLLNDLEKGGNFSSTLVWIFVIVIFICYLAVIVLELVLLGLALAPRPTIVPNKGRGTAGGRSHNPTESNFSRGMTGKELQQMPTKTHGQSIPKPR